jgi:hypothetical protein
VHSRLQHPAGDLANGVEVDRRGQQQHGQAEAGVRSAASAA